MADAPGLGGSFFQLNRWNRIKVRGPKPGPKKLKVIGGGTVTIRGIVIGMGAKALQKALAVFLASALGRELALQARAILPSPVRERVTDEELMREVEEWLRSQATKSKPGRKKGLAVPLGPKPPGRKELGPILGPRQHPQPRPAAPPFVLPDPRRTKEEPPDEESFAAWFERRFARSIVRHQRLNRRKRRK